MDKNNTEFKQYHEWLVTRSWSGLLYRKLYLYPKVWTKVKGRVLDVGCGIGDFVRLTKNAVGIDINPFNVEFCKKNGIDAHLFTTTMPFNDDTFDTVLFDNVIEHIYDPSLVLEEALRVLKKNGTLIIGVPGLEHFFYDQDHKVFYAENFLKKNFMKQKLNYRSIFYTPENKYLRKFFVHSCRWAVYEKK